MSARVRPRESLRWRIAGQDWLYFAKRYAGITVSNIDVLLYSLQRYRPDPEFILLAHKNKQQYLNKLPEGFAIRAAQVYPVRTEELEQWL